jgi:hypothetical protein
MSMGKVFESLRTSLRHLERTPFPDDSSDVMASQLHAELADYDGYVAGRIATLLAGQDLALEDLNSNDELKAAIETLAAEPMNPGSIDAKKYLEYLATLETALGLAREAWAAGSLGRR